MARLTLSTLPGNTGTASGPLCIHTMEIPPRNLAFSPKTAQIQSALLNFRFDIYFQKSLVLLLFPLVTMAWVVATHVWPDEKFRFCSLDICHLEVCVQDQALYFKYLVKSEKGNWAQQLLFEVMCSVLEISSFFNCSFQMITLCLWKCPPAWRFRNRNTRAANVHSSSQAVCRQHPGSLSVTTSQHKAPLTHYSDQDPNTEDFCFSFHTIKNIQCKHLSQKILLLNLACVLLWS